MTDKEIFLAHLDSITGNLEPDIRLVQSEDAKLPDVAVLTYENWPKPGFITAFTYGLSLANHPDWKRGRCELMISMESLVHAWPFAIGSLVSRLRGRCPFSYGNTIKYGRSISEESEMDAFLVFAPPHLDQEQKAVRMNKYDCFIAGVYPLYSSELDLYEQIQLEAFWHHPGWDPLNPQREVMRMVQ
jgi:hypothetical protein